MLSWLFDDLDRLGNVTAIGAFVITAIGTAVGIFGYCSYKLQLRKKRLALETYLANEKRTAQNSGLLGQKSMLNIIRHVGLTEDEILKISFASDKIDRRLSTNEKDGFADRILFEYVEDK